MIIYYTQKGLASGNDFTLRNQDNELVLSLSRMQRLGGRKYKVTDKYDKFLYVIEETDVENGNEFTIYNTQMETITKILRVKHLLSRKIIIKHTGKTYSFKFSLLPRLTMSLLSNEEPVVTALIKKAMINNVSQMALEAHCEETDELLQNITIFTGIGLIYTDSY